MRLKKVCVSSEDMVEGSLYDRATCERVVCEKVV